MTDTQVTTLSEQDAGNWYAVYTRPSHEKVVAEHLKMRDIAHFLPLYRKTARWRNRCTVDLQLPLFPGYVFVRIDLAYHVRVLQIPSVISLVSRGRVPEPLPKSEIEALQRGLDECRCEPYPYLAVGEKVQICSGALTGLTGFVLRRNSSLRVVITVEQIMKSIAVEVDGFDLGPVHGSTHRAATAGVENRLGAQSSQF